MRTLDLRALDRRSGKFADRLLSTYPDWLWAARVEREAPGAPGSLVVEIAPPAPRDIASPSWISARGGLILVAFDGNRGNHQWPPHHWRVDIWSNALPLIAAILDEGAAAASGWDGDRLRVSWWLTRGEDLVPRSVPAVDRARVRSWNGTLDGDVAFPAGSAGP